MFAYLFDDLGPWSWVVIGLVLVGLEMLVSGQFLLWLGLAAIATGLFMGVFGLSWQAAALVYAGLAVVFVVVGRLLIRRSPEETAGDVPDLNRRGEALVGRVFTLETGIVAGEGRVRVGDSSWRVTGPDAPPGASVRVVRLDGTTLVVEGA